MCRCRDDYLNRGLAPEGESLSFASPKESNQRKGDPVAACILRSSLSPGADERGSGPFVNVRPPCRTPAGYSRRKLRYSARQTGLNPHHRPAFFVIARYSLFTAVFKSTSFRQGLPDPSERVANPEHRDVNLAIGTFLTPQLC